MDRFVCIHGHFYQPPRENPWLDAIEVQDSASPFHDWNERIAEECYAPNAAARILDAEGRIEGIVNNYARISFNFGPTLLAWLEVQRPEVYQAILAADRESQARFSGHGSALAQAYNHIILPLASDRDRRTQVLWGVRDFQHRFGRMPEGMWLPEAAVDLPTLETLAELGLRFTILSPRQARRVRPVGSRTWAEVGEGIDTTRPYRVRLPSGRSLALFFYDGAIAQGVAFGGLLHDGRQFAERLARGFRPDRGGPQLVHIATDGESYGHHHRHGEMALAYALHWIESRGLARLTNYGEYLERFPPTHEVEIREPSSWSCVHGVERWRGDCGCRLGTGTSQAWRRPLREALDWLRDALAPRYAGLAARYLRDPWAARDGYIDLILDRSPGSLARFLAAHALRPLGEGEVVTVLKLLEMQRHALLMYTSCGWFFDDLTGLETIQILRHAGRALQLAEELSGPGLEPAFLERLAQARSNLPGSLDGRQLYEKMVRPAMAGLTEVGLHYGIRSLFGVSAPETGAGEEGSRPAAGGAGEDRERIYGYAARREAFHTLAAGDCRLALGRVRLTSVTTREAGTVTFGVLHLGAHNLMAGARVGAGPDQYRRMAAEVGEAFRRCDLPGAIRLLDRHLGGARRSLSSLFRDDQRLILGRILEAAREEAGAAYRDILAAHGPLMHYLRSQGLSLPPPLAVAAVQALAADLRRALAEPAPDPERIAGLLAEARYWQVEPDLRDLGAELAASLRRLAGAWAARPRDPERIGRLTRLVELGSQWTGAVDLRPVQDVYYRLTRSALLRAGGQEAAGGVEDRRWRAALRALGERLGMSPAVWGEPRAGNEGN